MPFGVLAVFWGYLFSLGALCITNTMYCGVWMGYLAGEMYFVGVRFVNTARRIAKDYALLRIGGGCFLISYNVRRNESIFRGVSLPITTTSVATIFVARTRVSRSKVLPHLCGRNFDNAVCTASMAYSLYGVVLESSTRVRRSRTG